MVVEFDTDDGRTVSGTVARLNRRTATIEAASGRWRVSPALLRVADVQQAPADIADTVTSHGLKLEHN
jgi:hypothetical protein